MSILSISILRLLCYNMGKKPKKEDSVGKSGLLIVFLMMFCCALPVILIAIGLGAIGAVIQSNLLLILAGIVIVVGIGYSIYRGRCRTCAKKSIDKKKE